MNAAPNNNAPGATAMAPAHDTRKQVRMPRQRTPARELRFVIDSAPGPTPGRFVEVENEHGASVSFGRWNERPDGTWELILTPADLAGVRISTGAYARKSAALADERGNHTAAAAHALMALYDLLAGELLR